MGASSVRGGKRNFKVFYVEMIAACAYPYDGSWSAPKCTALGVTSYSTVVRTGTCTFRLDRHVQTTLLPLPHTQTIKPRVAHHYYCIPFSQHYRRRSC